MKKLICSITLTITLLAGLFPAVAQAAAVGDKSITSAGAYVLEVESGLVLYSHNADELRSPASTTKLMTAYLVYEAIADGAISMDTRVPISAGVEHFSTAEGYSNVPLSRAGLYTVEEMLDVVLLPSACAAARALGELLGGSEAGFVKMMNDKAAELGIDAVYDSSFGSLRAAGISAKAMAELNRSFLLNYPQVLEKTSQKKISFHGGSYRNTNKLLGVYKGLDGMKTGTHILENFIGTAQRDGLRIIAVTMGSAAGCRYKDATILLDYGFAALAKLQAQPSNAVIRIDEREVALDAYTIDSHNYLKIRDLAYALNGTAAQFAVAWTGGDNMFRLAKAQPYTVVGGEMAQGRLAPQLARPVSAHILLGSEEINLSAYSISGESYFKLRDLALVCGFDVSWDSEARAVVVSTN